MAIELTGPAEEGPLIEALKRIAGKTAAFSLVVSDGVAERIFYFAIGGIRVIRSGPRRSASIGELLVDAGKLRSEDIDGVLAACRELKKRFGESAVALGLIAPVDVENAVRQKVEEELLDLFLWDGAEYRLIEGQPPKEFYAGRFHSASLTCSVPAFLDAILARLDDWRGIVGRLPNGREVYRLEERADVSEARGAQARLLELLDGNLIASDAISKSGLRRVPAYEFLLCSLRDGHIRRVSGHQAQKVTRDQVFREIDSLEEALKTAVDARIVRARLARACETAGEKARAAGHWKYLGDHHRKHNHLELALEYFRNTVRLLPTDFATRELILDIHRFHQDFGQLVADGRPLADLFIKHNLLNRAKQLLLQLVGIVPKDASLRRQLIMVLIGLGEKELSLHHLRELAELLEERGAPDGELRDVYLRILALDKRDKRARERLDELTGIKSQRRIFRWTALATAATLLACALAFGYEAKARYHVQGAFDEALLLIEQKDYEAARAVLDEAARQYPYSPSAAKARALSREIEGVQREERALQRRLAASQATGLTEADLADLARQRQQRETEAFAIGEHANQLALQGRLAPAHDSFRELFDLYPTTKAAERARVPLKMDVLPRDARVLLDGKEVGQGSLVLTYSPLASTTLRVERDGFEPAEEVLNGVWNLKLEMSLRKPVLWTHWSDTAIDAPPALDSSRLFVAGRDRTVTALLRKDGTVLWRRHLGLYDDVGVAPVVTPHGVVVGTASGAVVCLGEDSGEVHWRIETGSGCVGRPVSARNAALLVFTGEDGSLVGIDTGRGEEAWRLPPATVWPGTWAQGIDDDTFAFVGGERTLQFGDAAAGELREFVPSGVILRSSLVADIDGDPDRRLWAVAEDGSLRVFSSESGRSVRRVPIPAPMGLAPCVAGDTAFAPCADGSVLAFDGTGGLVFETRLPAMAVATPAFAMQRLYVPAADGRLHVLDAASGDLLWRFHTGDEILATPVVDGGVVYLATEAGELVAMRR